MGKVLNDQPIAPGGGILHHAEGVDLMPSNIQLSGMEVSLVNAMSRETILRQYLDTVRKQYTHILLDCQPSLGMLTVNALAAANRLIAPVQAEYLPAKGLRPAAVRADHLRPHQEGAGRHPGKHHPRLEHQDLSFGGAVQHALHDGQD